MKLALKIFKGLAFVLLAAFLIFRVPDTDAAAMRLKYATAPSQFVSLDNGLTVHLRDEGPRDAPVIVLLHGSNDDLHTWEPWANALKTRYRVIRYDQRGHGLTGPAPDRRYGTDAFAGDLDAIAASLGIERFVLAGNSMGGGIAARFAMLHPGHVRGLVLVDAAGAPVKREGGGNLAFSILRMPVLNRIGMSVMPRPIIEKSMHQSVGNPAVVTPAMVDRIWELSRYPGNREATLDRFSQGYSTFTPAQVASIRSPTLVMWGEKDALVPLAAARWYMANLRQATLVSYPEAGHLPMEEIPAKSVADLERWLGSLPPDAGGQGTPPPPTRSASEEQTG